ncbi:kinase-like domain-containing protein [Thermoascus aurantiacus ATCC 26904]
MDPPNTIHELSGPVRLTPSMLPSNPNEDFRDSSFHQQSQLPSPDEVRAQAQAQHRAGINPDRRKVLCSESPHWSPPPVVFESLGLFVKWGGPGGVPVPEIYGWRTDGGEVFLYLQLLRGQTLEQAWEAMGMEDRVRVCQELRTCLSSLRRLEQDPVDPFVGNIGRSHLYDRTIPDHFTAEAGPFSSVTEFHDWFTFLCRRRMPDPYSIPVEPFRYQLPDNAAIKFTHGDLHRSNTIVTGSEPRHVVGIVDWEQAGWLPEYWEARKARWTAHWTEEWSTTYLPMILEPYESTRTRGTECFTAIPACI